MQCNFQTTESRLDYGCSNWDVLETGRSCTSSSSFQTLPRKCSDYDSLKAKMLKQMEWWKYNLLRVTSPVRDNWGRGQGVMETAGGRPHLTNIARTQHGPWLRLFSGIDSDQTKAQRFCHLWLTLPPCLITVPFYFALVQQHCTRKVKITHILPSAC